eukprot:1820650-Prorocentrum_lima.AAC.1
MARCGETTAGRPRRKDRHLEGGEDGKMEAVCVWERVEVRPDPAREEERRQRGGAQDIVNAAGSTVTDVGVRC